MRKFVSKNFRMKLLFRSDLWQWFRELFVCNDAVAKLLTSMMSTQNKIFSFLAKNSKEIAFDSIVLSKLSIPGNFRAFNISEKYHLKYSFNEFRNEFVTRFMSIRTTNT